MVMQSPAGWQRTLNIVAESLVLVEVIEASWFRTCCAIRGCTAVRCYCSQRRHGQPVTGITRNDVQAGDVREPSVLTLDIASPSCPRPAGLSISPRYSSVRSPEHCNVEIEHRQPMQHPAWKPGTHDVRSPSECPNSVVLKAQ